MDCNESEVAEAVLRNLGLMITATNDLATKVGKYQTEARNDGFFLVLF